MAQPHDIEAKLIHRFRNMVEPRIGPVESVQLIMRVVALVVLREGVAPVLGNYTDPLPQALVLTAIVIAFAMTAVSIVLAMRSRGDNGSDHVDALEEGEDATPVDAPVEDGRGGRE